MKPAAVKIGLVARLVLLTCTALGVALLHTLGHAGNPRHELHGAAPLSVPAAVVMAVAGDDDGCGCVHFAAPVDERDTTRWWYVCLAMLSMLVVGVLAVAVTGRIRAARQAPGADGRFRIPRRRRSGLPYGLAITMVAVVRT